MSISVVGMLGQGKRRDIRSLDELLEPSQQDEWKIYLNSLKQFQGMNEDLKKEAEARYQEQGMRHSPYGQR